MVSTCKPCNKDTVKCKVLPNFSLEIASKFDKQWQATHWIKHYFEHLLHYI